MIFEIQKASVGKRLAAFLLDAILAVILIVGVAALLSAVTGYDSKLEELDAFYFKYEDKFGVSLTMTEEEFNELSEEGKTLWQQAYDELCMDTEAMHTYRLVTSYTLIITIFSILIPILVLEFIVPLILKNGQTLGKKIFGICLMQNNGVKVTTFSLFVRSVLGKYVLETMIPVLIFLGLYFGVVGRTLVILTLAMFVAQVVLFAVTSTRSFIHDLISYTVVVDYETQRIFDNADELVEYKKQKAAEIAQRQPY